MTTINLRDVSVLAPAPLFRNLDLSIADGDRLGLVAGNGAGKTTLLRCIAGIVEPASGEIVRSRGLRVAMVEQDVPHNLLPLTLDECVRRALPPAERESGAWRVDLVLDAFGTPAELRDRPLRALSGGWQRLALIARVWVAEPDVLLLDEPTNHLDLAKMLLLEGWINAATRRTTMVIASHDRHFLDACTTHTLFLRENLSRSFAHPYARARQLLAGQDAAHQAAVERDSREVERLRQSASALRNIGINSRSDAAQKKSMLMAKRADRLEQSLRPVHAGRSGDIRLANRGTHARTLLRLDDVVVPAPDGRVLFRTGRLHVQQQDRIVVLGRNGVGKSQFVALLRRAMIGTEAVDGIAASPSVVPAWIDQDMSQLPATATPLAFIAGTFRLGDQRSTSLLAGAGFTVDRQRQPIGSLSPGQKARLALLALRLAEPNFYLMDEPTSHVDIAGQEQLEDEILAHGATCILVSHDRSFMQAIGTRFLLIDRGRMTETDGPGIFYRMLAGES